MDHNSKIQMFHINAQEALEPYTPPPPQMISLQSSNTISSTYTHLLPLPVQPVQIFKPSTFHFTPTYLSSFYCSPSFIFSPPPPQNDTGRIPLPQIFAVHIPL
jgi:hypothetical protein